MQSAAGLGELGKHGSLISREFGPNVRLATVLTDLPLEIDAPVDIGVEDLCAGCRRCTIDCPADAIADTKQLVRGALKWYVDFDRCVPYFTKTIVLRHLHRGLPVDPAWSWRCNPVTKAARQAVRQKQLAIATPEVFASDAWPLLAHTPPARGVTACPVPTGIRTKADRAETETAPGLTRIRFNAATTSPGDT